MKKTRFSAMQLNGIEVKTTPFLDSMVSTGREVFFESTYTVAAGSIEGLTAMILNCPPGRGSDNVAPKQTLPGILPRNDY